MKDNEKPEWHASLSKCRCVTLGVLGRNRRVPSTLSPTFLLFIEPSVVLFKKLQQTLEDDPQEPKSVSSSQRRPGPAKPRFGIPRVEWPNVVHRIEQGETLRDVVGSYNTSDETVRRVVRAVSKQQDAIKLTIEQLQGRMNREQ